MFSTADSVKVAGKINLSTISVFVFVFLNQTCILRCVYKQRQLIN